MAEQHDSSAEQHRRVEGGELLSRISDEMVRALKEFYGKGPTKAKAYMLDDMLVVVMRGAMTTAEQTMLQFGHPDQVRQFRQLFQDEMTERLTDRVEEVTGRRVLTYQSQVMFDPDVIVELFVLDSDGPSDAIEATAEGQLEGEEQGMATDEDQLDPPASGGH